MQLSAGFVASPFTPEGLRIAWRCYDPPMRIALLIPFVLLLAACGGDVRAGEEDAAPADANDSDANENGATDTGAVDANAADANTADANTDGAATDAAAMRDVVTPMDVGDGLDARVDAPASPPGPLQCRASAECSGPAAECQLGAPGGVCTGCGDDVDCPGVASCFGASCVVDCDDDTDCNAGFRCLASGRCAIRSCATNVDCGPYECRDERCARWRCDGSACPSGFTCAGDVCIEE